MIFGIYLVYTYICGILIINLFYMLFKYKITLDVEVEFDAPLLGTDTTKNKRKQVDGIAKKALQEMINFKTTSNVFYFSKYRFKKA